MSFKNLDFGEKFGVYRYQIVVVCTNIHVCMYQSVEFVFLKIHKRVMLFMIKSPKQKKSKEKKMKMIKKEKYTSFLFLFIQKN